MRQHAFLAHPHRGLGAFALLLACAVALANPALAAPGADTEWPTWGNDAGGSRYSPLADVHRGNVGRLREAWRMRTGDLGAGFPSGERMAFEATPILAGGLLYLPSPYGRVFALDPGTGAVRWRFDARTPKDHHYSENASRGVSYWRDPSAAAGAACATRIFQGTLDARLIALDARTGRPCAGFGRGGTVVLNKGPGRGTAATISCHRRPCCGAGS